MNVNHSIFFLISFSKNPYLVKIDDSTCWSIWQTLGFGFTSVNDFAIANPGCDALYTGRSLCLTPMNFPACASFATAEAGKGCWDQWNDLADKTSFPDTSSFSNFNTACLTNSVQPGQLLCTKLA